MKRALVIGSGAGGATAAKELQKSKSGSAKVYAAGLEQAAQQFKGKAVTPSTVGTLLQALLSSQAQVAQEPAQSSSGIGDLLGSLLGGQAPASQAPAQSSSGGVGDLLGSLLGGQAPAETGNQPAQQGAEGGIKELEKACPNAAHGFYLSAWPGQCPPGPSIRPATARGPHCRTTCIRSKAQPLPAGDRPA